MLNEPRWYIAYDQSSDNYTGALFALEQPVIDNLRMIPVEFAIIERYWQGREITGTEVVPSSLLPRVYM